MYVRMYKIQLYTVYMLSLSLQLVSQPPFVISRHHFLARSLHHHGIPHHVVAIAIAAIAALAVALPSPHCDVPHS